MLGVNRDRAVKYRHTDIVGDRCEHNIFQNYGDPDTVGNTIFFFLCTVNFRDYANLGIIFKLVLLFNTLLTDSVRLLVYYIFTYVFYYTFGQLLLKL